MSEIVDVVDKSDKVIGKNTRANVHKKGILHRGTHAILFNSKGDILLPVRSATKDAFPNTYDCSVSEHVGRGEKYEHAISRGIKEELGIRKLKLNRLVRFWLRYGPHNYKISTLYEAVQHGKLVFDKNEIKEIEYVSKARLKRMLIARKSKFAPWSYEILKWYLDMPSKLKVLD